MTDDILAVPKVEFAVGIAARGRRRVVVRRRVDIMRCRATVLQRGVGARRNLRWRLGMFVRIVAGRRTAEVHVDISDAVYAQGMVGGRDAKSLKRMNCEANHELTLDEDEARLRAAERCGCGRRGCVEVTNLRRDWCMLVGTSGQRRP